MVSAASSYPPLPSHDDLQVLLRSALANAKDLLDDAQVLVDAGRFPRALALATLSWEEVSKADLCALAIMLPEITPDYFWEHFRNHEGKLSRVHAFAGFLRPESIGHMEEYAKKVKGQSKSTQDLKERGFYVDYRRGKVLLPGQIGEKAARKQIKIVRESLAVADAAFSGEPIGIMFTQLNVAGFKNAIVAQPDGIAAALQEAIRGGSQQKLQSLAQDHESIIDEDGD
jgi:AbiV family abortive infection protein